MDNDKPHLAIFRDRPATPNKKTLWQAQTTLVAIRGSDGSVAYLSGKDEVAFFGELRALPHREDLDEKVVANF